jgi:hypothetical protein
LISPRILVTSGSNTLRSNDQSPTARDDKGTRKANRAIRQSPPFQTVS